MKNFWGRRLWLVIFGIMFVGLFAARLISSGGLSGIGIGFHLLGDSFTAAQIDLEHKGFRCGKLQSSGDQPPVQALACERANAQLTPPQDQIFRVEMAGSRGKITHVTTRVCGSEARPCPASQVLSALADRPVLPMMVIPRPGQPPPPSVTAAFSILCLLMTMAWCLDWRHYVRFWLGRSPNYQGRWVLGFRLFFAVNFLGSLQGVVRAISAHSWTFQDCKYTAFWLLVMTAAYAVLDGIFRFTMGRPKMLSNRLGQS